MHNFNVMSDLINLDATTYTNVFIHPWISIVDVLRGPGEVVFKQASYARHV